MSIMQEDQLDADKENAILANGAEDKDIIF